MKSMAYRRGRNVSIKLKNSASMKAKWLIVAKMLKTKWLKRINSGEKWKRKWNERKWRPEEIIWSKCLHQKIETLIENIELQSSAIRSMKKASSVRRNEEKGGGEKRRWKYIMAEKYQESGNGKYMVNNVGQSYHGINGSQQRRIINGEYQTIAIM